MARNLLLILLVVAIAGSMAFLLIYFLKRLKRIEKEMWEEKARIAKIGSDKRKKIATQARKDTEKNKTEKEE
jgi:uncharacterized protein YoxC